MKGVPESLAAVFLATTLQTCIVHLIRNTLDYASRKDRNQLVGALRPIYTVATAEAATRALDEFELRVARGDEPVRDCPRRPLYTDQLTNGLTHRNPDSPLIPSTVLHQKSNEGLDDGPDFGILRHGNWLAPRWPQSPSIVFKDEGSEDDIVIFP